MIDPLVWAAAIAATPPTLAVWLAYRKSAKKAVETSDKVEEVHKLANDRLTKALERIESLSLLVDRLSKGRSTP